MPETKRVYCMPFLKIFSLCFWVPPICLQPINSPLILSPPIRPEQLLVYQVCERSGNRLAHSNPYLAFAFYLLPLIMFYTWKDQAREREIERLIIYVSLSLLYFLFLVVHQFRGVWTRDIKLSTNIPQHTLTKTLKILEQRNLIKSVRSVVSKSKKLYFCRFVYLLFLWQALYHTTYTASSICSPLTEHFLSNFFALIFSMFLLMCVEGCLWTA